MTTYTIAIMGEKGCGKTSFIRRYINGEFEKTYIPNLKLDKYEVPVLFNIGYVNIKFVENDITNTIDGIIHLYDSTSKNERNKMHDIEYDIPYVIGGNKYDLKHLLCHWVKISCKTYSNVNTILLLLMRKVLKNKNLKYMDCDTAYNYNFYLDFMNETLDKESENYLDAQRNVKLIENQ